MGKAPPPPKPEASEVDRTSFGNLLKWFKVWRRSDEQEAGRFDQVGRDLGMDPEAKLRDYVGAMGAAAAAGCVETALLPGWNVLVYESPAELAACIGGFVRRRWRTRLSSRGASRGVHRRGRASLRLPPSPSWTDCP